MTLTLRALALRKDAAGVIPLQRLAELTPHMPLEVRKQFVSDHGAKVDFIEQYGDIDLARLIWSNASIAARDLADVSVYEKFEKWYLSVASRAHLVDSKGWRAVDSRREVSSFWETNRTWLAAPVLIRGNVIGKPCEYHVVEGHTRMGLLTGLLRVGHCALDSMHRAWVGEFRSGGS